MQQGHHHVTSGKSNLYLKLPLKRRFYVVVGNETGNRKGIERPLNLACYGAVRGQMRHDHAKPVLYPERRFNVVAPTIDDATDMFGKIDKDVIGCGAYHFDDVADLVSPPLIKGL